ncbi:FBP domain-containing protein [Planctomonas sp. JC2975]|uniref:FBP domain-containing protein n=1 Tax=Planctomonas sp. JC2975 TaxID=2729626 RepID=UPI0014730561|nr:FBP domain-containing protein [Planctomonas sp. JC2975]NNC12348.1 FBP domain-containing protein [Planctomonas sp. JC2975]
MRPVTEREIRASFVNASLRERNNLNLPLDFDTIQWDNLDYLGWRDRKYDGLAYLIVPVGDGVVGILLRKAEARSRFKSQCSWCEDVTIPHDVVFYSAKRSGKAGRNGDSVGTLVCEGFQCSGNVRRRDPAPYSGFDVEAARDARIDTLREHAAAFAAKVLEGD